MSLRARCTVESMSYSACGLAVGDYFDLTTTEITVPAGKSFCFFAVANILPLVHGRLDVGEPDDYLATRPLLGCPDPPESLLIRVEAHRIDNETGSQL